MWAFNYEQRNALIVGSRWALRVIPDHLLDCRRTRYYTVPRHLYPRLAGRSAQRVADGGGAWF